MEKPGLTGRGVALASLSGSLSLEVFADITQEACALGR
jgi:hypothetical protein